MLTLLVIAALLILGIRSGVVFLDIQLQYNSFIWGKRLGVKRVGAKRRSDSVTPPPVALP